MDDASLIRQHLDGDPEAFEKIVRAHWSRVVGLAERWLGPDGAEAAEDIGVEVFASLHDELPRWRGDARVDTWLYRTTFNKCGNHIQRMRRQRRISERLSRQSNPPRGESPDLSAQRKEESALLARALESLHERGRAVIELFCFQQLPLADIAAVLGISVSTVKRTLRASLDELKRILLH